MTPTPRPRTAVVAGAGPGGAAAALLLARLGLSVTVLERVAAPAAVGGALLVQPNGRAVLQALGVEADVGGAVVRSGRIHDRRGRVLLRTPVAGAGPGLDANLVVRRADLFGRLHEALAADDRVEVRLGTTAVAVEPGGVRVTPGTGSGPRAGDDGGADLVAADVVVAADGVRSALRAGVDPTAEVRPGRTYLRAIVPGTISAEVAGEWWTRLGLFGAAPLGDGSSYLFASAAHPDLAAALAAGDVAALAARWGDELRIAGEALGHLTSMDQVLVNGADEVHARRWTDGRTALLGDAAHAMVPNTGQGANSALVDAAVLALELAATDDVAVALGAYEQRRRPAATRAQADARALARLAHTTRGPAVVARALALRAAAALPPSRQARRLYQEDPAALRAALTAL